MTPNNNLSVHNTNSPMTEEEFDERLGSLNLPPLYDDTAALKQLSDDQIQAVWDHHWMQPTMLCHAFRELWEAIGDDPESKAGHAIKRLVYVLEGNSPLWWRGVQMHEDGQDFSRICGEDSENNAFWNAFADRTMGEEE